MDMTHVAGLAQQQLDAEHAVELADLKLKEAKEALRVISEDTIPEVMEQLELETVTTAGGLTVSVKATTRANISKANAPKAFAWLRKNGHQHLIKPKIVVVPDNDKQNLALQKRLAKFNFEPSETVNAQSLSAFVREMLEEGKSVPEKLLGVYTQKAAKITVKK